MGMEGWACRGAYQNEWCEESGQDGELCLEMEERKTREVKGGRKREAKYQKQSE